MARPYSLTVITDIAISTTVESLLSGRPGRFLDEPSIVSIWATRETVDVLLGITIGRDVGLPNGSVCNLNATNGTLPSRQDDLIWTGFGNTGEEIIVQGVNEDAAAANELRLLVDVLALSDT